MLALLFSFVGWGHRCGCGDAAAKSGGTRPSLYESIVLRGDYIQASTGLRFSTSGSLTLSGLPDGSGAYVAKAYLIYAVIGDVSHPEMSLNGVPVSAVEVASAPSPCWGEANIYTYIADVTDIVRAQGDGTYTLSDYYCPPGDPSPGGAEGATLVAIYCEPEYDTATAREISIYLGAYTLDQGEECDTWGDVVDLDTLLWDATGFSATNPVTSAKLTVLFADGQDYWNGNCGQEIVRFNGYTLRSGVNGLPGGDGFLWDAVHVEDASSMVPGGSSSASNYFEVKWDESGCNGCVDCVTLVGEVFSVSTTKPETYDCLALDSPEGCAARPVEFYAAGNRVFLRLPRPEKASISVYSADGRLVKVLFRGLTKEGAWELRGLSPGVYRLLLRTGSLWASTETIIK